MAEGDRGLRRERRTSGAERGERKRGPAAAASRRSKAKRAVVEEGHLPLERANLVLFAIALGVIVLGYVVLARGSITLAPILLVLGYCVLVPLAIVYRSPSRRDSTRAGAPPEGAVARSDSKGE